MNVSVRDNCRFSFSSLFASSSDLNEGSCVLLVIIVISRYTDQVMTLPFASLSFELRHGKFCILCNTSGDVEQRRYNSSFPNFAD